MANVISTGISKDEIPPEVVAYLTMTLNTADVMEPSGSLTEGLKNILEHQSGRPILDAIDECGRHDHLDDNLEAMGTTLDEVLGTSDGPAGEITALDHGMGLSLRTLLSTGRATRAEVHRMALAPRGDRQIFIKSRAPVPAGTFPDGKQMEQAEADRIVRRIYGRK